MLDASHTPLKLLAVETHPIQYKAPLFRALTAIPDLDLTVFFAMIPDAAAQGAGFGVSFAWDTPLLEGYRHKVLDNRAKQPSVTRFSGCDTPELYALLKRERPDAVLVNGWVTKTCLQTLWTCRRLGIPCMVRGEANLLRPRAWWKHALHRMLLSQYCAYLAIGKANRDFYRFHHCPEDRIFPAPYCVDNDWFAAEAAKRSGRRLELRGRFGIPADAFVFLFAGKLESKKHPIDVLRALRDVVLRASCFVDVDNQEPRAKNQEHTRAFLLIVGDGPLRAECEAFVAAHDLPVRFAGFLNQSQLPDAYAAADVLVLPSDAGETWGLVVNEAMASGRPAIVSRAAGCCMDLIIEGSTGYAFDLHDVQHLSALMGAYLKTRENAKLHGENAARHIKDYTIAKTAAGIVDALRQIPERISEALAC